MVDYLLPRSVSEATKMLDEHGRSLAIIAGGTGVMRCATCRGRHGRGIFCAECPGPRLIAAAHANNIMDIRRLGLNGIERSNGGFSLGAGLSLKKLRAEAPVDALRDAAGQAGAPALRNMATVGGNIFSRQPYGDIAVVLLALDATLVFAGPDGERSLKLAEFYEGDVNAGGLLTRIDSALPEGQLVYLKCGRRRFNSPTVITVAICIAIADGQVTDARIALGGASAHPMRCTEAEQALIGNALDETSIAKAGEIAAEVCSPETDVVASEWYRRRMVGAYVRRALGKIE